VAAQVPAQVRVQSGSRFVFPHLDWMCCHNFIAATFLFANLQQQWLDIYVLKSVSVG
jgi:hypothetical protein